MNEKIAAYHQLTLSTIAFGIAFAVWGSLGGAASLLKEAWGLKPLEVSWMVALPVMMGSLTRIPMGLLTDRWGPRFIMSGTLVFSGICELAIGLLDLGFSGLLFLGALVGMSGSAFVTGVAHLSSWFGKTRQGWALGIFGMGNFGQSLAVYGVPLLALIGSWKTGFISFGVLSLVWALIYAIRAREFPGAGRPQQSLKGIFQLLIESPMAWTLSLFYFLTFGGFVAMSVYLPTLVRNQFFLSPQDAGKFTAVFVIAATLMRPLGGYFSDRWGGLRILFFVFLGVLGSSLLLMTPKIGLFAIGVLGFAIAAGLGNGAVFKLVPHHFPDHVGSVTGLVGTAGGLGGFFPPLVMGFSLQHYGHYLLGWAALLFFSIICILVLVKMCFDQMEWTSSAGTLTGNVVNASSSAALINLNQ